MISKCPRSCSRIHFKFYFERWTVGSNNCVGWDLNCPGCCIVSNSVSWSSDWYGTRIYNWKIVKTWIGLRKAVSMSIDNEPICLEPYVFFERSWRTWNGFSECKSSGSFLLNSIYMVAALLNFAIISNCCVTHVRALT